MQQELVQNLAELGYFHLRESELREPSFDADLRFRLEHELLEREEPHHFRDAPWTWGQQVQLGVHAETGKPNYLPKKALVNGALVEGRQGTRKTSGLAMPLLVQAINSRSVTKVISISYKSSPADERTLFLESAVAGRKTYFWTNVPGEHSFGIPLLQDFIALGLPWLAFANSVVRAFGYDYGPGGDDDYFRDVKEFMTAYVPAAGELGPGRQTFEHLARLFMTYEPQRMFEQTFRDGRTQMMKTFFALASLKNINVQRGVDECAMMDLARSFRSDERETFIFKAIPEVDKTCAIFVPLMLLTLLNHAMQSAPDSSDLKVLIVIDEASNAFSLWVCDIIQRLRAFGVGVVFLYQHPGQLKQGKNDYRQAIEGYAALKVYLSLEDKDRLEFAQLFGGERMGVTSQSWRNQHTDEPMDGEFFPERNLPSDYYPQTTLNDTVVRNVVAEAITTTVGPTAARSTNDLLAFFAREGNGMMRSSFDRQLYHEGGTLRPCHFPFVVPAHEQARRGRLPWPSPAGTRPVEYRDVFADALRAQAAAAPRVVVQGNPAGRRQGGVWGRLGDMLGDQGDR